jgi:hypothetical protein
LVVTGKSSSAVIEHRAVQRTLIVNPCASNELSVCPDGTRVAYDGFGAFDPVGGGTFARGRDLNESTEPDVVPPGLAATIWK